VPVLLYCNAENFPSGGGIIAPGFHLNLIQAYESMKRVSEAADIIIPIHDLDIVTKKTIPD
jgi:N-acyl homoserine lactone hydrolase